MECICDAPTGTKDVITVQITSLSDVQKANKRPIYILSVV